MVPLTGAPAAASWIPQPRPGSRSRGPAPAIALPARSRCRQMALAGPVAGAQGLRLTAAKPPPALLSSSAAARRSCTRTPIIPAHLVSENLARRWA